MCNFIIKLPSVACKKGVLTVKFTCALDIIGCSCGPFNFVIVSNQEIQKLLIKKI